MTNWLSVQLRQALGHHRTQRELARVDRNTSPPLPAELLQVQGGKAVWRVTLRDDTACFMSLRGGAMDDDQHVFMLDADRFYRAWLESSLAVPQGRGCFAKLRPDMHSDYKFSEAAKGFACGRANPVQVATTCASPVGQGPGIYFINSVTRTYWLLAHDASAFPVEVFASASAWRLHRLTGIGAGSLRCTDLFGDENRGSAGAC